MPMRTSASAVLTVPAPKPFLCFFNVPTAPFYMRASAQCPTIGLMQDVIYIGIIIAFFAVSALYVRFCGKL